MGALLAPPVLCHALLPRGHRGWNAPVMFWVVYTLQNVTRPVRGTATGLPHSTGRLHPPASRPSFVRRCSPVYANLQHQRFSDRCQDKVQFS